jgi:hypothetical protein
MLASQISLAAQGVSLDSQTGSVSVFNILEGIAASGLPVFVQNTNFFAMLTRAADDPPDYDGTFTISMGEDEIVRQDARLVFGEKLRNRLVVRIPGIVITRPGILVFRLRVNDRVVAEYETTVTLSQEQPQVQADQQPAPR